MDVDVSQIEKRKDYDKKYYEKKKQKVKSQERVELDYELDTKAKPLALKFMSVSLSS